MAELLTAGIDCFIDGAGNVDANGDPLDVTGYTVQAVARATSEEGPLLSEWSTLPGPGIGEAIAGGTVPDRVRLVVTPEQSSTWDAMFVVIQAEMESPTGKKSRPIDTVYQIKHRAVA